MTCLHVAPDLSIGGMACRNRCCKYNFCSVFINRDVIWGSHERNFSLSHKELISVSDEWKGNQNTHFAIRVFHNV
jgi:hypothetical protein